MRVPLAQRTLIGVVWDAVADEVAAERLKRVIEVLSDDLSPLDFPKYDAHVLNPYKIKYPDAYPSAPKTKPVDEFERLALERFLRAATAEGAFQK